MRIVGCIVGALGMWACHPSSDAVPRRSEASSGSVTPAPATTTQDFATLMLDGTAVDESGNASRVELTLRRDAAGWQGQWNEAAKGQPLELMDAQLLSLGSSAETQTYRLTYAVDLCQHAQPSHQRELVPWKSLPCAYAESEPKPRELRQAELRVIIQRREVATLSSGTVVRASAVGAQDITSLSLALVLDGYAQ